PREGAPPGFGLRVRDLVLQRTGGRLASDPVRRLPEFAEHPDQSARLRGGEHDALHRIDARPRSGRRRADPAFVAHPPRECARVGQPMGDFDHEEHGRRGLRVRRRRGSVSGRPHGARQEGRRLMLTSRRAPVIAGVASIVVAALMIFVLVLPKLGQVSDAKKQLEAARAKQSTLESQLRALQDAKNAAPVAQKTIDRVNQEIPPTADLPGLILLLQNAATSSGIDLVTITPSTPAFDATTGLSTISVSVSATGTYFALTEYLYKIETLPRAAKVLSVTLSPGETSALTMAATLDMFTADTSAGPGSSPGPQGPTGSG